MNDPQLAAALRSRSPDALPGILDAYGDRLFGYCWCLLRNRENAQIAVRDALVVAAAQIGRLDNDEWLGLWLYSLARAECRRREATPAGDADEPAARPHQGYADFRLVAWKAVMSMAADEVEVLELECRHDVDLSLVLGLPAPDVEALVDRAQRNLERAVGAEIVIRQSQACPDRANLMSAWTGITTPAVRDRVLEHASTCSACGPNLPRSVSATRVFALLPTPALSTRARLEVLEFFGDSGMSAYRDFVVSRAAEPTGTWFLTVPEPAEPAPRPEPAESWFQPARESPRPAPIVPPEPAEPASGVVPEPTDLAKPALRVAPNLAEPALTSVPEPAEPALTSVPEPAEPAPRSALEWAEPELWLAQEPTELASCLTPEATGSAPASPREPAGASESVGSGPVITLEPLAEVIPLPAPPPAEEALPRSERAASAPPAARRRHRGLGVGIAAAAVVLAAVFTLVGLRITPSPTTASGPAAVASSAPGSATAPSGSRAAAGIPVKAKQSPGAPSTIGPFQQSAANRGESLAVAAASQPGTSSPSSPGHSRSRGTPASSPASTGSPIGTGTLTVAPDRLDLGTDWRGQLTLTAVGGPVSWSASTSSSWLTLNDQQGTLQAGQSVTLLVSVSQGGSTNSAYVFIDSAPVDAAVGAPSGAPSASQAVEVIWTTYKTYYPSSPHPSPSPSDSSSPSPSPSSSSSSASPSPSSS